MKRYRSRERGGFQAREPRLMRACEGIGAIWLEPIPVPFGRKMVGRRARPESPGIRQAGEQVLANRCWG